MANNLVTAEANRLLDASFGTAAYVDPTGPMKLRLLTANGSASASGTEVVGGSYVSQTITLSAAASGATSNSNTITFAGMPACTVVGLEIWDSAGSPRRAWWGALADSKDVEDGDDLRFPIGDIDLTLN